MNTNSDWRRHWLIVVGSGILCLQCATPTYGFFGSMLPKLPPFWIRSCPMEISNFLLFSSFPSSSENHSDDISPLEAMRKMLEASWNAETMGRVPLDATAGANEVYSALLLAAEQQVGEGGIFFVELLLPALDIAQGERIYDEVMATEFCISLSKCLKGKSEILVRDKNTLDTVEKVFRARERMEIEDDDIDEDDEEDEDDDDEEEEDEEKRIHSNDDNLLPTTEDTEEIVLDDDVDAFRQKLLDGWVISDSVDASWDTDSGTRQAALPVPSSPSDFPSTATHSGRNVKSPKKRYRLASLFGNDRINPTGADMPLNVVRAVRNNAMAMNDEDNIIILNARGQDEMVAVRALADKYQSEKKMILVNCQFKQLPTELQQAETVYSILPLVVTEQGTGNALSINDGDGTKVVVLRRYPNDWEIFVDIGKGFELAETARDRPSMDALSQILQRYFQSL